MGQFLTKIIKKNRLKDKEILIIHPFTYLFVDNTVHTFPIFMNSVPHNKYMKDELNDINYIIYYKI